MNSDNKESNVFCFVLDTFLVVRVRIFLTGVRSSIYRYRVSKSLSRIVSIDAELAGS